MGAARREKPADGKKRKGADERRQRRKRETNAKGREEKTSLPIVAARISRRGLLGEREKLRNENEEENFLRQHAVSRHCAVAPSAIRQEPCHSSHTFSGSISQSVVSTSRRLRMSGDETLVLPSRPPSLFFPGETDVRRIPLGDVADYLVTDNSVLG